MIVEASITLIDLIPPDNEKQTPGVSSVFVHIRGKVRMSQKKVFFVRSLFDPKPGVAILGTSTALKFTHKMRPSAIKYTHLSECSQEKLKISKNFRSS